MMEDSSDIEIMSVVFRVICGHWELLQLKWLTANHVS